MSEPETLDEKPPISIWKRTFVALGVFVGVLFALGFASNWYDRERLSAELRSLFAGLDKSDPGWRLDDIEAARTNPEPSKNSAHVVMTVVKLLPGNWPEQKFDEQFNELPIAELLDAERLELLSKEMQAVAAALVPARRLAELPEGRHRLIHAANPIATLLPDQQEARKVASLLRYDVLHQAATGDMKQALRSCRAILNAGRSLGDEPFMISQLIRMAVVAIALGQVERTLSLGEAPADELAELAKLLALEEKHPTMLIYLRGERAMQDSVYRGLKDRSISAKELAAMMNGSGPNMWGADWQIRLFGLSRSQIESEHRHTLELMTRYVEMTGLSAHEQIAVEKRLDDEVKRLSRSAILTRLLMPAVTKVNEASRRKLAQVRAMQALVAVERYRLANGTWPEKLADVTPALLAAVLLDPFDGKPLRYKKLADGVLVYSTGPDGVDHGGAIDRQRPIRPGTDMGYQLWDVKARRQPAKPKPMPMPVPDGAPGDPGVP